MHALSAGAPTFSTLVVRGSYAVDAQHPTVFLYFSTLVADTEIT